MDDFGWHYILNHARFEALSQIVLHYNLSTYFYRLKFTEISSLRQNQASDSLKSLSVFFGEDHAKKDSHPLAKSLYVKNGSKQKKGWYSGWKCRIARLNVDEKGGYTSQSGLILFIFIEKIQI